MGMGMGMPCAAAVMSAHISFCVFVRCISCCAVLCMCMCETKAVAKDIGKVEFRFKEWTIDATMLAEILGRKVDC